jgi:restriction endonuclease S subunit
MAAVDEKTGAIGKPEVVPYSKVRKGYTYFEENDVLFAKITPCMQNGKHVIAKNLIDGISFGTTEFHVLRPYNEILSEWVYYFIRQPLFLREATAYFTGAVGQQRVPESFLSNYIIPLPPIEEQKRIATKVQELMQDVERARTACEKQLEAAKSLHAAYLREVFQSEESKKWEKKRLGEVCEFSSGKFIQKEKVKSQGAYPVYGANGIIGFTDERIFDKEVIIIGRVGSCGMVNKSVGPAWITDNTIVLEPLNQVTFDFLYWKLKSLKLEELRAASVQPLITQKDLKPLLILLPPLLTQQRIAQDLKEKMIQVENLQSSTRNQESALNALPQAILRKAFRGEL